MARIETRDEFMEYIMEALGHPIVTVNITETQLDARIDDALLKFFEFHNEGSFRYFIIHEMTDTEIKTGEIKLPDKVMSVVKVYPTDGLFNVTGGNNLAVQSYMQKVGSSMFGSYGLGGSIGGSMFSSNGTGSMSYSLSNMVRAESYMSTVTATLNGHHQFQYSRYGQKLWIDDRVLGDVGVGDKILVEVYMEVDDENQPIWDSIWLRQYATELARRQWGDNLTKLGNTQLANGTTINAQDILQQATERLRTLEEELMTTWAEPLGVIVG